MISPKGHFREALEGQMCEQDVFCNISLADGCGTDGGERGRHPSIMGLHGKTQVFDKLGIVNRRKTKSV